ncbi:TRAP transporter substrate-binding protein [uncultured Dysosmobacter sp.]|uniref:TRAP transporter substrate-binding protein n=1 Tax=uncultured Dysosmobacter sp. TaxID=2591384 RepID=UPI00262114A4|nr:TRAP transporter substrate-binding protein [uncultured Dysosmobacter sp.]
MKVKKILALVLVMLMAVSMAACGGNTTGSTTQPDSANGNTSKDSGNAEFILKVGHSIQEETPTHQALLSFEKEVEEKSGGRIDVQIYANGALGTERAMTEAVQMGTLEVTLPSSAIVATFDPMLDVLSLPFLFPDAETARSALSGDFGDLLTVNLESIGLVSLGWLENGVRYISNNKHPINTLDDMKGIKIRTIENEIQMNFFSAWGASPNPMAYSELFTALQQGVVDAQENSIFLIKSSRFEEVTDYLLLTPHWYCTLPVIMNKAFFDSLPEDLQTIVKDAMTACSELQYELCDAANEEALAYLMEHMETNELTEENLQKFIDACAPVYEDAREQFGDEVIDMALSFQSK